MPTPVLFLLVGAAILHSVDGSHMRGGFISWQRKKVDGQLVNGGRTIIVTLRSSYYRGGNVGGIPARRSSAEHLIATKALRCTATARKLTVAESFAKC